MTCVTAYAASVTDLLDPPYVAVAPAPDDLAPREPSPSGVEPGVRAVLASLAAGAGAIHLAMAPSHAGESLAEGVAFAAGGLLQLGVAAAVLLRPGRAALRAAIIVSLGFAAAWTWSRTVGLPFGSHAGEAEVVGFVDGLATALALGLALVAAVAPLLRGGRLLVPLAPLAVGALVAAAVVSPSARDHAGGAHGHDEAVADDGFAAITNGHAEHHKEPVPLDAATQRELDAQLAVTREVAGRYPTVQDALDAGYFRAGPYVPGIGAHFLRLDGSTLNPDGVMDRADLENPLALIYTSTAPGAELAGFMYYSMAAAAPEGFAGPNDVWHFHEQLCMVRSGDQIDFPFGPDRAATPEQCSSVGGMLIDQSQWMVHVWSVPGWDRFDGGVFAEVHPGLDCSDGTYHQLPPEEWDGRLNVCRSAAS